MSSTCGNDSAAISRKNQSLITYGDFGEPQLNFLDPTTHHRMISGIRQGQLQGRKKVGSYTVTSNGLAYSARALDAGTITITGTTEVWHDHLCLRLPETHDRV